MLNSTYRLNVVAAGLVAFATCVGALTLAGCQRKERVVDVKTPIGDVKVDKNVDTGGVEVKTNTK